MVRDPLALDGRRKAYELVLELPGLHLRDLARRLGVDVRTALYHLDQLGKHGLVMSQEEAGFRRYYPRSSNGRHAEVVDARDKRLLGMLRRRIPLYICLVLLTRDHATHGELVEGAGVSRSTMSYHLKRMRAAGVLGEQDGQYELADPERVAKLLYAHRPAEDVVEGFLELWDDFRL